MPKICKCLVYGLSQTVPYSIPGCIFFFLGGGEGSTVIQAFVYLFSERITFVVSLTSFSLHFYCPAIGYHGCRN